MDKYTGPKQFNDEQEAEAYLSDNAPGTLIVDRLMAFLGVEDTARVIHVLSTTCRECGERDAGCQCWNDE